VPEYCFKIDHCVFANEIIWKWDGGKRERKNDVLYCANIPFYNSGLFANIVT
jgi:hypothetical protein